jgi:hypothetical protein
MIAHKGGSFLCPPQIRELRQERRGYRALVDGGLLAEPEPEGVAAPDLPKIQRPIEHGGDLGVLGRHTGPCVGARIELR